MCKNYRNVWFQANTCVPKHTDCLLVTHLACSKCRVAHARNIILMYVFVSNLQCILYTFKYVQATGKCDFNPTQTPHGTQILFLQHSACSKCRVAQARNNIFLIFATNLQVHTSTYIHIRQDVWFQANTLQSTQIAFQQHLACSKCGVAQLGIHLFLILMRVFATNLQCIPLDLQNYRFRPTHNAPNHTECF